jgi:type II secretory pathway component PulK
LQHARLAPRNAAPKDVRELRDIRGFESIAGLDSVLGIEPDRVSLNHAPLVVLAAMPNVGEEVITVIGASRRRGQRITSHADLIGALSGASRVGLNADGADLSSVTTLLPESWLLTARASGTGADVISVLELKLVGAGSRVVVSRRRTWLE